MTRGIYIELRIPQVQRFSSLSIGLLVFVLNPRAVRIAVP